MSDLADIVENATNLLGSIDGLLESAREIDLPGVAAELGVAGNAASITEQLVGVMEQIAEQLEVVTVLGQLGGLFGMLEPLVGGLAGIFADAGRHVADLGLDEALVVGDAIASGFDHLEGAVALGASLALSPSQVQALRSGATAVVQELAGLADDFRVAEAAAEQSE
ncbi:MAG: hypothetical protein K0V04_31875 [Deltaproteobacteria bacterium]|nr:hypothetical protein [Deltaproteobacteria bacterium]